MKRIAIALILTLAAPNLAVAASKSPTPTPTPTATSKTTAKATAKATSAAKATPTSNATTKTTVTATAKATTKATAIASKKPTKKPVYKPRPRKKVSLSPSPTPVWPPLGYQADRENPDIYAKIPTRKDLIGYASANSKLATQLKDCEIYICGVLVAASQGGCNWWEFNTDVYGPTSDTDNREIKYGSITSLYSSSKPKQSAVYLLISKELIKPNFRTSKIQIACHREPIPTDLKVPSNTYLPNN